MSDARRSESLRARAAALGVPEDRRDAVADELAVRLDALRVVSLERLEDVPPALAFSPRTERARE